EAGARGGPGAAAVSHRPLVPRSGPSPSTPPSPAGDLPRRRRGCQPINSVSDTLSHRGGDDVRTPMDTRTGVAGRSSSCRTEPALHLDGVRKSYGDPGVGDTALDGVSLVIAHGTFTAVMGPSGSGKRTLLQCAACLDRPGEGTVVIDGIELTAMTEAARTRLRRGKVGFIFQQFNLLPTLTVLQNVALPMRLARQ